MIRFEERDDVTVQNPPAGEVVLFYTDGAFRIKDSAGEVTTITTVEGLEEVAEATEPKVYVALLTQSGTDAPVATVLKNTLGGTVVWTRDGAGLYIATLANAFVLNKTTPIDFAARTGYDGFNSIFGNYFSTNQYTLDTYLNTDLAQKADDVLGNTLIKIEVYP